MQHVPRQTTPFSSSSSPAIPNLSAGPTLNATSVAIAPSNTSTPISDTSIPPVSIESSLPPSVIDSPPPTSLPPSTTLPNPPTSLPPNAPISSNTSTSSSSSFPQNTPASLPPPGPTVFENITTIVTSINGQATTFTSQLPTSLVDATPNSSSSPRTAVIAGTTAGLIVLLCLALAGIFGYRRHRLRRALAHNNQRKEGKGLLDGEEFDDDDVGVPMRWHQDRYMATGRSDSPAPSLIRSRVSETGSIFREEIWPPPGFVDPIKKGSSQVNLGHIVDDVMGPTSSRSRDPFSSTSDDMGHDHQRDTTYASTSSSQTQVSTNPFGSNNDSPSVYYPSLPPGALPPTTPGQAPSYPSAASRSIPQITETPPTPGPDSQQFVSKQNTTAQPKKSSPLARPLSTDASIWLGRSPHSPHGDSSLS